MLQSLKILLIVLALAGISLQEPETIAISPEAEIVVEQVIEEPILGGYNDMSI